MAGVFIPQESADAEKRVIFSPPETQLLNIYQQVTVTYPSKSRSQTHHLHPSSFIYIILIALRFVSFSFLFSFPLFSFYFVLLSILLPPLFLPSFLHKQNSYNEVRHPLARMWLEMARLPGTRASRRLPLLLLPAA